MKTRATKFFELFGVISIKCQIFWFIQWRVYVNAFISLPALTYQAFRKTPTSYESKASFDNEAALNCSEILVNASVQEEELDLFDQTYRVTKKVSK